MAHLTNRQLQAYADQLLDEGAKRGLEIHVRACEECADRLDAFRRLEGAIRRIPLEQTKPDFTHDLMQRLSLSGRSTLVKQLVLSLSPILLLALLTVALYLVVPSTGEMQDAKVQPPGEYGRPVYYAVGRFLGDAVSAVRSWIGSHFPLDLVGPGLGLATLLGAMFVAVGLLDRFVFTPMMKKRWCVPLSES
jgi:anti-sigma factor RsiW